MHIRAVAAAALLSLTGSVAMAEAPLARAYTFEAAAPCKEDPERAAKPSRPGQAVYDVCADQMAIYQAGLKAAEQSGKLLLVTFGATWCPWCAALQKAMPTEELLGRKGDGPDLGATFHHIEIGLSTLHKGKKADIPSGEAVLNHVLAKAPGVKIRAIPFVAVIDPKQPDKAFARNIDDIAKADGTHDMARVRSLLGDASAFVRGSGALPSEPGWLKRKWLRWWYG